MTRKFNCFPEQFFFQNEFIDKKKAVLTGRPNFSCSITGIDPKKSTKMQKLFRIIFFKVFQWRGRKQLESPADFYRQLAEHFLLDFLTKVTNSNFCREKKFHPKVSIENENPVLTKAPRFSLQNPGTLSFKVRKRLEEKP